MNALVDTTPANMNYMAPTGITFVLKRAPVTNFFCQKANIPGISFGSVPEQPTPFLAIPHTGDHLLFEELNINFKVDENLVNYLEIWNWLIAIGYPEDTDQYAALARNKTYTGQGIKSDGSLIINSNEKNPRLEIIYEDLFPVSLSSLNFDTTDESVNYISATASFRYTKYQINALT
jgi:hypothetical protein